MNLVGKKILVTGGNGYLGNYFAVRCFQKGAKVMALSRYTKINTDQDLNTNILRTIASNGLREAYLNQIL